jgi:hypothetical protein
MGGMDGMDSMGYSGATAILSIPAILSTTGGLEQLGTYLERLGLAGGTLVLSDGRPGAPPAAERAAREEIGHGGRRITVLRP